MSKIKSTSKRLFSTSRTCEQNTAPATGVNRRQLLAGAAAAGFAATGFTPEVFAEGKPRCIDVHSHIVPPSWLDAMDIIGRKDAALANWSVQKMIEDMDRGGVATAITSPTTPQVTPLGKEAAARIARESNEYAKKLEADHPGRFGTFAMLPLPNIDDSLKEIAYAFDTLKVDGVAAGCSAGCIGRYELKVSREALALGLVTSAPRL
jgi:predicted TIM-barrel fold metal-dependent hydrolase